MVGDSFTVVSVVIKDNRPASFICATDTGTILEYPVEGKQGMASLLKWHPEVVRNLTLQDIEPPYALFPTELNGEVAGTILCTGVVGGKKIFRVVTKSGGVWCTEDISEEETLSRIKGGRVAKAEARGNRVVTKAPIKQSLFASLDKDIVAESKQGMGEKIKTNLLFITEASNEAGDVMKYAGLEFVGSPQIISSMQARLNEQSLLFREAYYETFGRSDSDLAMQYVAGRIYVVLPYPVVESLLLGGKRAVKITRVLVSSVAFRGGRIFDEAKVVISGVMGYGEIRGSAGSQCDKSLRVLLDEVQANFKYHTHLMSKINKGGK